MTRKATLIQGLREYVAYIVPYIRMAFVDCKINYVVNEKELIKWIIAEELELIHGLFDNHHEHNKYPHQVIHSCLNKLMPVSLSIITDFYIKVPHIYEDNAISIKIDDFDIYISYISYKQRI